MLLNGYTYESFEPGLWTVGYRDPSGTWHPESDHKDQQEAAGRVHYLNGGTFGDAPGQAAREPHAAPGEVERALAVAAAQRNQFRIALERIADGSRNRDGMMGCASRALADAAVQEPAPLTEAEWNERVDRVLMLYTGLIDEELCEETARFLAGERWLIEGKPVLEDRHVLLIAKAVGQVMRREEYADLRAVVVEQIGEAANCGSDGGEQCYSCDQRADAILAAVAAQAPGQAVLEALIRAWAEKASEPGRDERSALAYTLAARDLRAAADNAARGLPPGAPGHEAPGR